MTLIQEARLGSVEPIVAIVGMTEAGDMLIEDRNGVRYALRRSLVDAAMPAVKDEADAEELEAIIEEVSEPVEEPKIAELPNKFLRPRKKK